jgi:hypothetical protein
MCVKHMFDPFKRNENINYNLQSVSSINIYIFVHYCNSNLMRTQNG